RFRSGPRRPRRGGSPRVGRRAGGLRRRRCLGLPELLKLLLVAPWWRDIQEFTAEESQEAAAEYREDIPDLAAQCHRVADALGLTLPTEADALARMREVALGAGEDFVLIFTPEGNRYDPLIRN
ncbi:MAG TPA: hypothetical protein VGP16_00645, partial [Asanoa sp.]|nr:hypothetical protein [Asanoa sp.]